MTPLLVAGPGVANAPIVMRLTKSGLDQVAVGMEASVQWEAIAQPVAMTTADIHEGIAAWRHHCTSQFRDH